MLAQSHRAPVASPGAGGAPRYNRRPSAAIPFRMNVLFEDDGQLKAGTRPRRSRRVAAGRGRVRQAAQDQGGQRPAALRVARRRRRRSSRRNASPPSSTRSSCGKSPATASSASTTSRASTTARRPRPRRPRRSRCSCPRRRCISIGRGKGRYRKAPADALPAALASVERKKREAAQADEWAADLAAHRLPDAFRQKLSMLLYKPDKNALEWKALARACETLKTNPVELLAACGAIPSTHDYHFNASWREAFPQRHRISRRAPPRPTCPRCPPPSVRAFSIDDASTTEIDDAFSVRELASGNYRIGVHIAAPALAIPRGSAARRRRRARACRPSTCPAASSRCCPTTVVEAFTLAAGATPPALSLYVEIDRGRRRRSRTTTRRRARAGRRQPAPARRSTKRSPTICRRPSDPPWTDGAAGAVEARAASSARRAARPTSRASTTASTSTGTRPASTASRGVSRIVPRPRGSPLDKLVAELMIHVNSQWGKLLADAARRGPVPGAVERQGEDEHAAGRAPGPRPHALPVVELAAAPLQRPRQPAPVAGGDRRRASRRTPTTTPSSTPRSPTSRPPTRSTPSSRIGWSTTGACAGCCRSASPRRRRRSSATRSSASTGLPLVVRLPDLPALAARNAGARRDRAHRPAVGVARVPLRRASSGVT